MCSTLWKSWKKWYFFIKNEFYLNDVEWSKSKSVVCRRFQAGTAAAMLTRRRGLSRRTQSSWLHSRSSCSTRTCTTPTSNLNARWSSVTSFVTSEVGLWLLTVASLPSTHCLVTLGIKHQLVFVVCHWNFIRKSFVLSFREMLNTVILCIMQMTLKHF